MKVSFCVEDENDRRIYAGLVERVLGRPIEVYKGNYALREGGFNTALQLAHPIVRDAFSKGADVVVLAVDNDDQEPPHSAAHDPNQDSACRWCRLAYKANLVEVARWANTANRPFHFIIGVPVRTIETWLLVAAGYSFSGAPEAVGLGATGRKTLKRNLYGYEKPDSRTVQARAMALIEKLDVDGVASRSASFHHFVEQIRALPNTAL